MEQQRCLANGTSLCTYEYGGTLETIHLLDLSRFGMNKSSDVNIRIPAFKASDYGALVIVSCLYEARKFVPLKSHHILKWPALTIPWSDTDFHNQASYPAA